MATKTTVVNKYRRWDHVYDTQNYISSPTDFVKLTLKGPSQATPPLGNKWYSRKSSITMQCSAICGTTPRVRKGWLYGREASDHINPYHRGESTFL